MPINGIPLALLCARRLSFAGADVVLATSDAASDDLLAMLATQQGVAVFRGSENDVLGRFVACTEDLPDDAIIVRMTADNPFPDHTLVEGLVRLLLETDRFYLGTRWPEDGFPYGVSAEAMRLWALRQAAQRPPNPEEREHVTPFLVEWAGQSGNLPESYLSRSDLSAIRCSIDTLDDYLAVAQAFTRVDNTLGASWQELATAMTAPGPRAKTAGWTRAAGNGRIALGTAQFGMPYGITNRTGCPSDRQLRDIVAAAIQAGITSFDTARAYGSAEDRLRSCLDQLAPAIPTQVTTKVPPLSDLVGAGASAFEHGVEQYVFRSCHALGRRKLDVVLLHRAEDIECFDGLALQRLGRFAEEGVIGQIGVSVYSPDDALRCLADARVGYLQLPFNLLDQRWLSDEFQAALRDRADVTIQARSIFLQGLLINPASAWPAWFEARQDVVAQIEGLRRELRRRSLLDLCLAYVLAHRWIQSAVVGVERMEQLAELVAVANEQPLTEAESLRVRETFAGLPVKLLNPSMWNESV